MLIIIFFSLAALAIVGTTPLEKERQCIEQLIELMKSKHTTSVKTGTVQLFAQGIKVELKITSLHKGKTTILTGIFECREWSSDKKEFKHLIQPEKDQRNDFTAATLPLTKEKICKHQLIEEFKPNDTISTKINEVQILPQGFKMDITFRTCKADKTNIVRGIYECREWNTSLKQYNILLQRC